MDLHLVEREICVYDTLCMVQVCSVCVKVRCMYCV